MLAAVSTAVGVHVVDFDRREVRLLPTARTGPVYGISWFPGSDRLCLGFARSIPPADGKEDLAWYARSEIGFVSNGDWTSATCLSHPHQLLCASDGRVVCTNTGRNCLTILDPSRPGHFQEWRLTDRRWDRESGADNSGDHLNSVCERDGELWVLAHRFDRGSRIARLSYPSLRSVEEFDVPMYTGMHNVWIDDDGRCLALGSHAAVVVDARSGSTVLVSPVAGYARGLARTRDQYVIGISPKARRGVRGNGDAYLLAIDRLHGDTGTLVTLRGAGAVCEVRVLDQPDLAHHGMPLANAHTLAERATPSEACFAGIAPDLNGRGRATGRFLSVSLDEPAVEPGNALRADADCLCVMMSPDDETGGIALRYAIPPGQHGLVSIGFTIGSRVYQDRGMVVMVLAAEPAGTAAASIWRRTDGDDDWSHVETCGSAATLPREGLLSASRHGDGDWQFEVDGHPIPYRSRDLSSARGRVVLRWLGATIQILQGRKATEP